MMTEDQIAAEVAAAYGKNLQDTVKARVVDNSSRISQYYVGVKVEGQEEVYFARFNPYNVDPSALTINLGVVLKVDDDGEYEVVASDSISVRTAYPNGNPPPNMTFMQHDHSSESEGGDLGVAVVGTPQLVDDAVTQAKMADNSVGSAEIQANAVTTAKIGDNQVTDAKIVGMSASKLTGLVDQDNGGLNVDVSAISYDGVYAKNGSTSIVIKYVEATVDPTPANDSTENFAVWSRWLNTTTGEVFECVDDSVGAAVWNPIGSTVDLSSPPPIGDGMPNTGDFTILNAKELHVTSGAPFSTDITPSTVDTVAADDSGIPSRRHRRARSGLAALQSGNTIGRDVYDAHNGTGYQTVAEIRAQAAENQTTTARGARLVMRTTRNGTISPFDALTIEDDGTLPNSNRGLTQYLSGVFFVQNAQKSVASATETSLVNTTGATGTLTFPANWWKQNRLVRFKVRGNIKGNTTTNALILRIKMNSADRASISQNAVNYGGTDVPYEIEGEMMCVTTGVGGTIRTTFRWTVNGQSARVASIVTNPLDTTIAQTFDFTADWTSTVATDVITADFFTCEALN